MFCLVEKEIILSLYYDKLISKITSIADRLVAIILELLIEISGQITLLDYSKLNNIKIKYFI